MWVANPTPSDPSEANPNNKKFLDDFGKVIKYNKSIIDAQDATKKYTKF
jgi:hypothetical protein